VSDRLDNVKAAGPAEAPGQRDLSPVSFDVFFREHFAALSRAVRNRMMGDRQADLHLAEDIVQQTFIVALERWDLLREFPPQQAHAYLRKTAMNRLTDSYRITRHDIPTAELPDYPGGPDPEAAAIAADSAHRELEKMPPARRRVMSLVMDGFSSGEIAELTGMSTATVRSHRRDARKQTKARTLEGRRVVTTGKSAADY
jgi:RNA polymerase sigma-70 factor, ECF subfamily